MGIFSVDMWAKQAKLPVIAWGARIGFLLLFASIVISISCAPSISLKKTKWEEIEISQTPTQGDYPQASVVFLADEGRFSVTDHWVFTRHVVIKILNEAGLKYASVKIPFYSGTEVHNIKGRTIRPDSTIVELQPADIHEKSLFPQYVLYTDSKAKVFALPGTEPGSVIEYSYSILYKVPFSPTWRFQRSEPVLLSSFILDVPAFLQYNYMLVKKRELEVEKSISHPSGRIKAIFKLRNAPPITPEPYMPPPSEVTTRVSFTLTSLSMFGVTLPIEGDSWEIVGHNYWLRVKEKIKANKAIKSKVREITKDSTSPMEKIAAIYDFVQSKIRYVAIEISENRVIPHKPAKVFANRYGDCKDKVFLFITMLKQAGIDAYPVLARTNSSGKVNEQFISAQQFNHMVVAVPVDYFTNMKGYEKFVVKGDKEYTSSDDFMVLDATSRATPFGKIPWYLENTRALLIKEKGGRLMTIPSSPANANKTIHECEVTIQNDGSLICSVRSTKTGQEAILSRSFLQPLGEREQREWLENTLSSICPGAVLEDYLASGLFELSQPLVLNYRYRLPQYAQQLENLFIFSPSVLRNPMVAKLTRKNREHTIVFGFHRYLIDLISIEIPDGFIIKAIPETMSRSSSFGDYLFSCTANGKKAVLNKQLSLNRRDIPKEDYEEVRSFFESILASERKNITLSRKAN